MVGDYYTGSISESQLTQKIMGDALKDGRGDLAPTTYLLFKEIVYLIVGFTMRLSYISGLKRVFHARLGLKLTFDIGL